MIVCVRCQRIMRPRKNGVPFVELLEDGMTPYKLWESDQWECEDCGTSVLHVDSRQNPLAHSYEETFGQSIAAFDPAIRAKQRGPRHPVTVRDIERESDRMYDQEGQQT